MVSRRLSALLVLALALAPLAAHAAGGAGIRPSIEMTRIDSPSLSPDGHWALWREFRASIDRNDYDARWMIAPSDGSAAPRQLADAGEMSWLNGSPVQNRPVWVPGSDEVLFRKTDHGEVQVWRARADGTSVHVATQEDGNVRDIVPIDGGARFLLALGPARSRITRAEQAEYDSGTLIDASVDPQRPLYHGDWIDGRWASGRLRGFWFEQGGILPPAPPVLRVFDPASGAVRDAVAQEQALYAPPVKGFDRLGDWFVSDREPSGDARGVAVVLVKGMETRLAVVDAGGHELAHCSAVACSGVRIRAVRWIGSEHALLFETRASGAGSTLARWNISDGSVRVLATGEGMLNGSDDGAACATSDKTLLCIASDANEPPRVVAIDADTGGQRGLADPNTDLRQVAPRFERLAWRDAHGRAFTGYLAMPEGRSGPVPLIVNYYACSGYIRGGLGDEYPLRDFGSAGIAALCINRYPATPGVGGNVEAYRIAADGIAAAIDLLARDGRVDRTRVGMGGVSFGGEVAVWLAIHTRLLHAVSVANVMATPTYYWLNAVKGREVPAVLKAAWGLGDPDRDRKNWRLVSPSMNTDRITIPFLMQVPEQEYRPNVDLLARLQVAGRPAELWAFPDEMHIKWQPRHQFAANARNFDWFRFWLAGEADANPAKADQYARWRQWD
ncbi:MAG: hypothetical protein RIS94_1548 [Pseudomonadota bacterium]|jgi:hypothetical protein